MLPRPARRAPPHRSRPPRPFRRAMARRRRSSRDAEFTEERKEANVTTTRAGSAFRIPSRWVLGEIPARAVVFLRGVGTHAGARAAMAAGGYTEADHAEGTQLLVAVCAYGHGGANPAEDYPAREALTEIVKWVR